MALTFPVVVSMVAEPITGRVDTAFVARLGAAPLAALGVGTVLLSSSIWVFDFPLATGSLLLIWRGAPRWRHVVSSANQTTLRPRQSPWQRGRERRRERCEMMRW